MVIGVVDSGTGERHAPSSENRGPRAESISLADRLTMDHVSELFKISLYNVRCFIVSFSLERLVVTVFVVVNSEFERHKKTTVSCVKARRRFPPDARAALD